ncbi:MAG TPA: hypothetical protein GXX14_05335 [Clostridiaceae bacterium]|nr:hypothetical protein [Clostridiaceae bacterium]
MGGGKKNPRKRIVVKKFNGKISREEALFGLLRIYVNKKTCSIRILKI